MKYLLRVLIVLQAGLLWGQAQAADREYTLTVDTGFFERHDALAGVTMELHPNLDVTRATLRRQGDQSVPFWFTPTSPGRGRLHWVLPGETDSLTQLAFTFTVPTGKWSTTPTGSAAVGELVQRRDNLIPNGGFERPAAQQVSATWKGTAGVEGWALNDQAWRHRSLPDLKSQARPQSEFVSEGTTALRLVAECRPGDGKAEASGGVSIFPFVNGPTVELKPGTLYRFSYRIRFADVTRNGYISASVNFLDSERKRIFPKKYAINRLQCAYGTARNLPETYMNTWVTAAQQKRTLPDVRYGQISLSASFAGTCYVDEFRLRKIEAAPPVTVTVSPLRNHEEE